MSDYQNQLKELYRDIEMGRIDVEKAKLLIDIIDRLIRLDNNQY